jgi:chromosome segregation ATPase
VLALVCALGWGLARRDAAQLERELGAAQTALAELSASLRALESQRQEARSQLQTLAADASALAERLTGLEALLATDPAPAVDAQETRSPDDAPR